MFPPYVATHYDLKTSEIQTYLLYSNPRTSFNALSLLSTLNYLDLLILLQNRVADHLMASDYRSLEKLGAVPTDGATKLHTVLQGLRPFLSAAPPPPRVAWGLRGHHHVSTQLVQE